MVVTLDPCHQGPLMGPGQIGRCVGWFMSREGRAGGVMGKEGGTRGVLRVRVGGSDGSEFCLILFLIFQHQKPPGSTWTCTSKMACAGLRIAIENWIAYQEAKRKHFFLSYCPHPTPPP